MVEPVTEPSDRLGEQKAGNQRIREAPESHARPGAPDQDADGTAEDGAEDRDPTLPDVESVHPVPRRVPRPEVVVEVREHVVDARTDDAEGDRQNGDVEPRT